MLAPQKLEYFDFTAGITENDVPGNPKAYARADNFLIDRDKNLITRPGSEILGAALYQLPSGQTRVGSYHAYRSETQLFAQAAKELYRADTSWQNLQSVAAQSAFFHNDENSRVESAESLKRMYFVTDNGQDNPQFVYPDATGTYQLRQAGLPKPAVSAPYTDATLLLAGIALALDVRNSMLLHYADAVAHLVAHASAVAALTALTTPVDLASLITYVGVLKTQYDLHIDDAQLSGASQTYHIKINSNAVDVTHFLGRYAVLNVKSSTSLPTPTTLTTIINTLNDLRNRYNFHTYATITHKNAVVALHAASLGYATNVTGFGLNKVASAAIDTRAFTVAGATSYYPGFAGQYGPILAYVNQLKTEFNYHISSGTDSSGANAIHNLVDSDNIVYAPDATDLLSAWVLLAHLEFCYWWHYKDASTDEFGSNLIWQSFTGTAAAPSPTLTACSINGASFIGFYALNISSANPFTAPWFHSTGTYAATPTTVVGNGGVGTQVVMSNNVGFTGGFTLRITNSKYHYDKDGGSGSATNPTAYRNRVNAFDYSLTNTDALISEAATVLGLIKSHELYNFTATTINGTSYYNSAITDTALLTTPHYPGALGQTWPESPVIIDGQSQNSTVGAAYLNALLGGQVVGSSKLYALVWRYGYNVEQIFYSDVSTPSQESQSFVLVNSPVRTLPNTGLLYPITLSGLPVLANGDGQNWDTANVALDIYATSAGGTTFYKVGSVTNGTTTFVDSTADTDLSGGEQLYTTGGRVANDQPPVARYLTILNSTAYYGYIEDITSGDVFPNRVLQSIQGAPAAAPATFTDDLDDELTGLTNFNSFVLAFCLNSLYRMEGFYDELGNGGLTHQEISKTVGCVSQRSIVATDVGVFFAGTSGICWTDGYKVQTVSKELINTYNSYTATLGQRQAIHATYDKLTRRVYWAFKSQASLEECDLIWVLDLNWGGLSDHMSFTTMSGGALFTVTALKYYQGQLLRGDSLGYNFKYDDEFTSDPLIDPTTVATAWSEQPVLWDYQSCATHFGSAQMKKWVTRITLQALNVSNLSLQISTLNDYGRAGWVDLTPIRSRLNPVWGDFTIVWDDEDSCLWGPTGVIDAYRRMVAGTLRCEYKTVRIRNAYVIIDRSDDADSTGYETGDGD